jgi:RNA polymerase sigma-70 factor, ECF subfamily
LIEEKELIALALTGDASAADSLLKRYQPRLLRASHSFLGADSSECEDMVRDTFLVAFAFLKFHAGGEPLYPWLRQICVRLCYARRRGEGAILNCLDEDLETYMRRMDIERVQSENPGVKKQQKLEVLREMIKPLDIDSRQIIQLRNVNGMTYTQIGSILGISKADVASRLDGARRQMRSSLANPSGGRKKRTLADEFGIHPRTP